MATDFAVMYFALPVLIGIVVLIGIAFAYRKQVPTANSFLGIGRGRTALGFLGALAALLIYSAVDASNIAQEKVSLGHVTAIEAHERTVGWTLYLFILAAPFVVALLSAVGLPALALLRRARLASVAGSLAAGLVVAVVFAAWPALFPYNLWGGSHQIECVTGAFTSAAALCTTVALGFAVAARLPLLRSQ